MGAAAQSLKQKKGDETMERKQAKRKRGIPEDELAAGMFYLAAVVVRRGWALWTLTLAKRIVG